MAFTCRNAACKCRSQPTSEPANPNRKPIYNKPRGFHVLTLFTSFSLIPGFCLLAAAQQGPQIINPGIGGPINVPAYSDYTGFTKLWDGQTFNNWDGETDVWSIENGAIHADTCRKERPVSTTSTTPATGAVMHDFDLSRRK